MTKDELMLDKFRSHAKWALDNQAQDGSWDNFGFIYPDNKYSAMAQGEGCSLLLRAYLQFRDEKYLIAAEKAIEFMLKPVNNGGTTLFDKEDVQLLEYTHLPLVLNGWIFAIFGLYDYVIQSNDKEYKKLLDKTVKSLEYKLSEFDCGYWSYYDDGRRIASPFYHHLHVAQLRVLGDLFSNDVFCEYADMWEKYESNKFYKLRAFIKKAIQKIVE